MPQQPQQKQLTAAFRGMGTEHTGLTILCPFFSFPRNHKLQKSHRACLAAAFATSRRGILHLPQSDRVRQATGGRTGRADHSNNVSIHQRTAIWERKSNFTFTFGHLGLFFCRNQNRGGARRVMTRHLTTRAGQKTPVDAGHDLGTAVDASKKRNQGKRKSVEGFRRGGWMGRTGRGGGTICCFAALLGAAETTLMTLYGPDGLEDLADVVGRVRGGGGGWGDSCLGALRLSLPAWSSDRVGQGQRGVARAMSDGRPRSIGRTLVRSTASRRRTRDGWKGNKRFGATVAKGYLLASCVVPRLLPPRAPCAGR